MEQLAPPERDDTRPTLTLYIRHGCHLCEDMQDALIDVAVKLDICDVDADPEWYRLYTDKVPVLKDGDIELCRYFFEPLTVQQHLAHLRGTRMLYAIIAEDVENSLENRLNARPAHLLRLQDLQDQGRLVLAGPHPAIDNSDPGNAGFSGSLVVAAFNSLADAQAWADADPYQAAGVYGRVTVKPFKQVFPA